MARTIRLLLVGLLPLMGAILHAQSPSQPSPFEITLGQATAPLYGPWKFTIGDSPIDPKTGKPLWAEPDFDDSGWETVDLTPEKGAIDPIAGLSDYVRGWAARGHAGYWGYAWYRIRVVCNVQNDQTLTLAGPADVDDGYQAFADGELLGSFGDFAKRRPVVFSERPISFPLPRREGVASAKHWVLAFRLWMAPRTGIVSSDAGGMHDAPVIGASSVVALHCEAKWVELVLRTGDLAVASLVFGVLALVAFSLILFDRTDSAYFWIGLLFLLTAIRAGANTIADWTRLISLPTLYLILWIDLPVIYALWCIVWWVWFGRTGFRWLPGVVSALAALLAIATILGRETFPGILAEQVALVLYFGGRVLQILLFGLLMWIVGDAIRRNGLEGWLALPVVILRGFSSFWRDLTRLHLNLFWFPLGLPIALDLVADLLIAGLIALLLLRRLLQSVRRHREMALDVKQAQEVQEVILPEHHMVVPGLEIESEYRPAREVGGDFFQIIPHADDSVLIVAGDVAGKGLKAGMLVALLVGAIRTAAETDSDPTAILAALNRRLLGRGDARATCLALRIERDGSAVLANAGHLPPYLNGQPLEIEGSLPLGLIENLDCSLLQFRMSPRDRLLLVSDGVPEATDAQGKLFGFDRVLELVRIQPSTTKIAEAAQAFGQEDDISVISVTMVPVPEPTPAS